MLNSTINYNNNPKNLDASRGANQGEWIVATSDSPIFYIAAKDASPCVLLFIQGQDILSGIQYGGVAHISVAEKIDSIDDMIQALDVDWASARAYIISGKSDLRATITQDVYNHIKRKISPERIQMDLGNKSTKATMDIRDGSIYKEGISPENYAFFDPQAYFRAACPAIFFPEKKRPLFKAYDTRSMNTVTRIKV